MDNACKTSSGTYPWHDLSNDPNGQVSATLRAVIPVTAESPVSPRYSIDFSCAATEASIEYVKVWQLPGGK